MEPMSERYVNVAVPVAVLVTAGTSLAPERVAAKRSLTSIPTLSVQLLSAIAAASETPPNMTCLRMSASVPQGERGTAPASRRHVGWSLAGGGDGTQQLHR